MKTYAYIRYSTKKQDEFEQEVIISNYCDAHNIKIDERVIDRAVSGASLIENRKNFMKLLEIIEPGDCLLCSEVSRISRSMTDFSNFLTNKLKVLKARLIICNVGMDINCSELDAITEIQLQVMAFGAQFAREMLIQRIRAALEHRRDLIKKNGGFISKAGNWCTSLGPNIQYIPSHAGKVSAIAKKRRSLDLPPNVIDIILQLRNSNFTYEQIANVLNNMQLKTATSRKFYGMTVKRIIEAYQELELDNLHK